MTPLLAGGTRCRPSAGSRPDRPATPGGLPYAHGAWRSRFHDPTATPARRAAIAHATRGEWEEAVDTNRQLLELGPDIDAYNRLGKALAELDRHAEALEAYEQALERDATNRIAQRNVERLRLVMAADKPDEKNGKGRTDKAPATLFIEEMGKTGRARLINLAAPASSRHSRRATRSSWSSRATSLSRTSARRRSAASSRASPPGWPS